MELQYLILAAHLTTRIKTVISGLQDYLGSPVFIGTGLMGVEEGRCR